MKFRPGATKLVVLSFLITGCGLIDPGNWLSDPNRRQQQLEELGSQRARWSASIPARYRMEFRGGCQCSFNEFTKPVTVHVENETILSVVISETGLPPEFAPIDYWLTIGELFDVVAEAIDRDVDRLDVIYNEDLGYPEYIFVDADTEMRDDERMYRVENLEVLR
jgi:hypothetical protein